MRQLRPLCRGVAAAAMVFVMTGVAHAQETKLILTGTIVYRTSQKPVADRAVWFMELTNPDDLAARPGYNARLVNAMTDAAGRFRYERSTLNKIVFGLGLGIGNFLGRVEGGLADELMIEAGAEGPRDLGVLIADDIEETVPPAAFACEASARGAATPPEGLDFLVLFKRAGEFSKAWDKKGAAERQQRAPWETDGALQKRIAAPSRVAAGALVCIVETKTVVGEYRGIRPNWGGPVEAFRTEWEVRLIAAGAKIEKTSFVEDPPQAPMMVHSGASLFIKRRPDQDLRRLPERLAEWLAKKRPAGQ